MISSIRNYETSIPLTRTDPVQMWTNHWGFQLYTRVESEKHVGWGQTLASCSNLVIPYSSLIERIAKTLVGDEITDVEQEWKKMRRMTFTGGYGIPTAAISSIDTALWDIKAKSRGISLSGYLGGSAKKIKRYVSLSRYERTEDLVKVIRTLVDSDYKLIKIHQPYEKTIEAVESIRSAAGYDFGLCVDLNAAFDVENAAQFANKIAKFELEWIEEPIWPPDDFEALSKINKIIPVAAGENAFSLYEFKRLIELDALTYYQPDIAKVGGVTPSLEIFHLINHNNLKLVPHSRPDNGWLSTIATIQILSGLNIDGIVETPPNAVPEDYFDFKGEVDANGIKSEGLGIGIEPVLPLPAMVRPDILYF